MTMRMWIGFLVSFLRLNSSSFVFQGSFKCIGEYERVSKFPLKGKGSVVGRPKRESVVSFSQSN